MGMAVPLVPQWGGVTALPQKILIFFQMEMVHFYALFISSIDLLYHNKTGNVHCLYETDVLLIKLLGS